jgi:hypothetical protein
VTSTVSTYQHSLSAAVAREHVSDLLRAAGASRVAACLPDGIGHRTPRRRPAWWLRIATRSTSPRTA